MLPGCALYDAYMMTGFDNNEYLLITQVRTDAQLFKTQCDNPVLAPANAQSMAFKTRLFENYSEQIPRNTNVRASAKALNEIAQGLDRQYGQPGQVSPTFCRLKYSAIENSAQVIQHVVGARPR
jgi:hypothetical protein